MNAMCGIEQHFQRPSAFRRIPTGFRPKAQGCEARATLGNRHHGISNPNGVVAGFASCQSRQRTPQPRWGCVPFRIVTQGSSFLATLGFVSQSLWDCPTRISTQIFNGISNQCPASRARIPTGFRLKAQGCEPRATLGKPPDVFPTPTGLWPHTADTHK